jgi:hypothetical protein
VKIIKGLINVLAYLGFYIFGFMFVSSSLRLFWGIVFYGKGFNNYGGGVSDDSEPIDLDMMKWWLLIGIVSGIYLYYTGQLTWLKNWINKNKK